MKRNVQNKSIHAVATSIVYNRDPVINLPGPQQNLRKCNIHMVVAVNNEDLEAMRCRCK